MATYDLEEQEQISELKAWWARWGNLVTTLLLVAAVGVFAWQAWNWYQRNQATQASGILANVQKAFAARDAKGAAAAAGELIDKFPGTTQAAIGVLLSSKLQLEGGDSKAAKVQLGWAVDHAAEDGLREIARLRLANLLLDEKSGDEALKVLEREPIPAFAGRFAELRGDILAIQGKNDEARKAYGVAIAKADEAAKSPAGGGDRAKSALDLKLEELGGAQ